MKVPRHKPFDLLKQLPIPEKPWNSISMDFIEQLPNSSRYTAILVVVDQLSKLLCKTTDLHHGQGTYSEGGTHEETLHPQSKAEVGTRDERTGSQLRQVVDS